MITTIRLPDDMHQRLKEEAKRKGMTLNSYLIALLWEVLTRQKEGNR